MKKASEDPRKTAGDHSRLPSSLQEWVTRKTPTIGDSNVERMFYCRDCFRLMHHTGGPHRAGCSFRKRLSQLLLDAKRKIKKAVSDF